MSLAPPVRKLILTTHVTASVGWLGALGVFLAHALVGLFSEDDQMVRAASIAMGVAAWFVILPLSLASLTTGLIQALGTTWGLIRHYWVLFKLVLTALATIILLLKLGPISHLAEASTESAFSGADLIGLRTSVTIHAAGGLLVLMAIVVLAIYKPPGMTWYGIRKQRRMEHTGAGSALDSPLGTPLWVKVFGVIVLALIGMAVFMLLGGGHGPGAHALPY